MKRSVYFCLTVGLLTFGLTTFSACNTTTDERTDQVEGDDTGLEQADRNDAVENRTDAMEEAAEETDTTAVVEQ
ncbi:hypothetical protein [Pontibacter chitinilyticus]|uniref:hypothetical protein n=1 Tax=Pontibacter chitinilyticus TaxID=2674989 RepID=UPI00321A4D42